MIHAIHIWFYIWRWHKGAMRRMFRVVAIDHMSVVPSAGDRWKLWPSDVDAPNAKVDGREFETDCQRVHIDVSVPDPELPTAAVLLHKGWRFEEEPPESKPKQQRRKKR